MNGLPYYKAYPRDFIEGTVGMPFEVKCAYRLVLDLVYMHSGQLPDDAQYISGLLGCTVRKWNVIRQDLVERGKLVVAGTNLTNDRAIIELETLAKLQDKQRENASRPRKTKDLAEPRLSHTEPDTERRLPASNEAGSLPIEKPSDPEPVNPEKRVARAVADPPRAVAAEPGAVQGAVPDTSGSDEERFWRGVNIVEAKGVKRSLIIRMLKAVDSDFSHALRTLHDVARARDPARYLGAIVRDLGKADETAPRRRQALGSEDPEWVVDARGQGYPVTKEGKYWRFAGGLCDETGEQIGN